MGGGGGAFRVYEGFYLRASSQSILNTSKQRILRMKAAFAGFAARANVVTQVAEVANFSCWSTKPRLEQKPTKNY